MKTIRILGLLFVLPIIILSSPLHAAPGEKLIYYPVEPCRILNTGSANASISGIVFIAYGDMGDLDAQGGDAGGCPHPKATAGIKPAAIAANVTAVGMSASGNGNLVAYPTGSVAPSTSLLNYQKGTNLANSSIIKLCQGTCTADFTVRSNYSAVPAIVDVLGYYYELPGGIAEVALSGGDYTSPVDAMADVANWCGTPSATNQCLIKIAPGTYDLGSNQIVMQAWVSIQGSGQGVTYIKGDVSSGSWPTASLFLGANNTTLSHLSAENIGTNTLATAVYNNGTSPTIEHVMLKASATSVYNAVHNNGGASPMIKNSSLIVASTHNPLYSYSNCHPIVIQSYIEGGVGVWTKLNSSTKIENSYVKAPTVTVRTDGSGATSNVFATTLDGGAADAINGGTAPKCAGVADENNDYSTGPTCP